MIYQRIKILLRYAVVALTCQLVLSATAVYAQSDCVEKANQAVRFLRTDIRANAGLWARVSDCIKTAHFIEANCSQQYDRSELLFKIFDDNDELWRVSCDNLDTHVQGEAEVEIYGVALTLDYDFVARSSKEEIASVIAHETAHNLGYTHTWNPFGSLYYPLTVPEQVEACVLNGGTSNPPPRSDYIDRKACCDAPNSFCSDAECFDMTQQMCVTTTEPVPDETVGVRYCGNFFVQRDGSYLWESENPDAWICAHQEVQPTNP